MSAASLSMKASPPDGLVREVALQSSRSVPDELSPLVESIRERLGGSLLGVILYGSCLHKNDPTDGIVDFYAVVDRYENAYRRRLYRVANALLPPNVFYLEADHGHTRLRTKYAVISMEDFEKGTSTWFHSYIWARFAQPARLVYARDEGSRARIHDGMAQAVMTFLEETLAAVPDGELEARTLWIAGLTLAYAAELRAETDRARVLTDLNLGDFQRLTERAAPGLGHRVQVVRDGFYRPTGSPSDRRRAIRRWRLRRWQGRVLSILRLMKAVFTFENGVDYIAWKVSRHSGIVIEVTPSMRRHPILNGPRVLWRLLRAGALR